MTDRNIPPVTEADLHAWVDGQLPRHRHALVAQWLEHHPEDREKVAGWQRQNVLLNDLFGAAPSLADMPVDELSDDLDGGLPPVGNRPHHQYGATASRWGQWRNLAAALALFCTGIAAGAGGMAVWGTSMDAPDGGQILTDGGDAVSPVDGNHHTNENAAIATGGGMGGAAMAASYLDLLPRASREGYGIYASEIRHPVEVYADQKDHLGAWLGKRLDISFHAPDLAGQGFDLVGGRLVPFDGRPGALLMYQDGTGARLTVMVSRDPANQTTAFRFDQKGAIGTFYWVDQGVGYALSGEFDRKRLETAARSIYGQLPG